MRPAAIATWTFGLGACEEAVRNLRAGTNALDAVERGIRVVEDDPEVESVGFGGAPNADGVVELDAAVMWGPGRRCGAVAGLRDIREAISVARLVMERTPHCLLVGEGARRFALDHGFAAQELLTEGSRSKWEEWKRAGACEESHDTICVLGLDLNGDLCAGTSTSGIRYKLAGRVGDTPLVGCGLYCDNEVGAVAATGPGEDIVRYAMSFRIVEEMRRGVEPALACRSTIEWAIFDDPRLRDRLIGVIALDPAGRWGAAASREGFSAAVGDKAGVELVPVAPV